MTSKAEELWKEHHLKIGVDSWEVMDKDDFLAALREYGAEVRKRDAEVCERLSAEKTYQRDSQGACDDCAAAIEREELP